MTSSDPIFVDFSEEIPVDLLELVREKNTKLVYWDLGDTLVFIPKRIKKQIVENISTACDRNISVAFYDKLIRGEWKRRETPKAQKYIKSVKSDAAELEYWKDFFACALKKLDVQRKAPQLLMTLAKIQANPKSFEIYPYVQDTLAELERMGIQVGIISNAFPSARKILKYTKLIEKFGNDHIILSCEYNSVKPEESIYKKAIKKAGVEPHEILFIDDRESFLAGAAKLGINAVIITTEIQHFKKQIDRENKPKNPVDIINTFSHKSFGSLQTTLSLIQDSFVLRFRGIKIQTN